jgi:hypothetical protein
MANKESKKYDFFEETPDETPMSNTQSPVSNTSDHSGSKSGSKPSKKKDEIHLEDLFVTDADVWDELKLKNAGALKNWLTMNHPKSDKCVRQSVLSEITLIINQILLKKLKK